MSLTWFEDQWGIIPPPRSTAPYKLESQGVSSAQVSECLIIARRLAREEKPSGRGTFISLRRRPGAFVEAQELSNVILSNSVRRRLEDGPYGGIPIQCGDSIVGEVMDAPIDNHQSGWSAARILDASVAQTAYSLSNGKLWLPGRPQSVALPVTQLDQVGQRGLDSQFFISLAHKAPFTKMVASPTATYPALWNHDAQNETRMICSPDSQMLVRQGMETRAAELWTTASRAHLNRDFTFGSQPLAVAFTAMESIGG